MKFLKFLILFVVFAIVPIQAKQETEKVPVISNYPLQYNWDKIDVHKVSFPKGFGWGAATSAFQIEGTETANGKHIENNWTEAIQEGKAKPIGVACDHWNRYKEDVELIKEINLTDYRFSISWPKIMTGPDKFDADAMQHYIDLTRESIKKNIDPYIMLFHHTWPEEEWFKFAFEKEENIKYFVRFATYVFNSLRDELDAKNFKRIKWMTFNEPVGYCLNGYFRGKYPPYKKDLKLAGVVIKNMLDAHVAVYHEFKKIDPDAQIGFAKIIVPIDPYRFYHPIDRLISGLFDYLQNYCIFSYFTTGKFTWGFPVYARFTAENDNAIGALDFISVNYYHNVMLRFQCIKPKVFIETVPGRIVWGENKCIYPEGLYRAVVNVNKYLPNVPIIIGENGIATDNQKWREQYIKQHIWIVSKLIKDGYDVRAYHWWALMDTYSWGKGTFSPYGFYKVDPETYERTLRKDEGFEDFIHFIKNNSYA